jgi:hypothetical protein
VTRNFDFSHASDDVTRHMALPNLSVAEHLRGLMAQASSVCRSRRKLYLDTRYWVFLREAAIGRPNKPEHAAILTVLREKVATGLAVCPVSDVAFMELTSQTDDNTRAATARLWDELSLGIALESERTRVRTELDHFLSFPELEAAPGALRELVWTRPCFILGPIVPDLKEVPPSLRLATQKAFLDTLWEATFEQAARDSSASLGLSERHQRTAADINLEMRRHQHEIPSFEKAFLAEVFGALSVFQEELTAVLSKLYAREGASPVSDIRLRRGAEQITAGLTNGFRYRRGQAAKRLPTLYLFAMCHAAVRMDVQRKFNGNFLRDIHHGMAGVAYHDAMFTEKPLKVLLTAGNVAVDTEFACQVLSDEREVLAYVESI